MLYPNGQRALSYPGRRMAGSLAASGALAYGGLQGARFNRFVSGTYSRVLGAVPSGYGARAALFAVKAGGMAALTRLSFTPAATGVLGLPGQGSAAFTLQFASAAGGLIVSGAGAAELSFCLNSPLLTASINGTGTALLAITTTPALLGAIADGTGAALFTLAAGPVTAYPINDSSPLRTGAAGFAMTGTLTPYAVGVMLGSTADTTVLTAEAIAAAVWDTVSAQHTGSATMGGKLNTASAGGVDLAALADAVLAKLSSNTIPVNLVQVRGQTIDGSGSESDPWGPSA